MGAQDDVAVIQRGYEAFGAGDMDTLRNLFTVWGRPVHLETELEGEGRVLFSQNMNGGEHRII